jgi:uncharacterized membrane protein
MARADRAARLTLFAAAAGWAAGFSVLSIERHRAFETGRFDLGNMVQAVWSTAHGRPLEVTSLAGEQTSRLGSHVDPILAVFAPLWLAWPSPDVLVVSQALAVALGALPVFWLARKHLGSETAGLAFALAYLLLPATEWLTLNEFHPVALACPLLLYAFWFLDEGRLLLFAVFAFLAATTKEEVALVVTGFGVWYALARGRRSAGAAIAALGIVASAIAVWVVVPHYHGGASPYASRYSLGNVPDVFDGHHLGYLADLLVPLGGLWLAAPLVLVAALPELALNLLSSNRYQSSIHFHYVAGVIPPLVAASVLGAAAIARRRPRLLLPLGVFAVVVAIASNARLGALPFWTKLDTTVTAHDRIAEQGLRLVPKDAPVSATNTLGAHLSARRRILSFPKLADATWVVADERKLSYLDSNKVRPAKAALAELRRNPDWRLVLDRDGILVFRKS